MRNKCLYCDEQVHGAGMCSTHYQRWRTYGDPFYVQQMRASKFTVAERVAAKTIPGLPDFSDSLVRLEPGCAPCRLWRGEKNSSGYGRLRVNGKKLTAHRALYEEVHDVTLGDLVVDHLCRNRSCCEITHLEAVAEAENYLRGLATVLSSTCGKGHEYTPENTYWNNGKRYCLQCKAEYYANKRNLNAAKEAA